MQARLELGNGHVGTVVSGLIALVWVASCGGDEEAAPAVASAPPPAVVVTDIRVETVPILREFVARTEAANSVDIQARVEAILEKIEFVEGEPVAKDQVLYRLDSRTYDANLAAAMAKLAKAEADRKLAEEQVSVRAAEAALAEAQAKLAKAEQDVARYRPLAEKDAVPKQDLDTALAAEQVAIATLEARQAELENAKIQEEVGLMLAKAEVESSQAALDLAQLDLEYCTIRSPLDGLIGRTEVDEGNLVGRGEATVLNTVSTIDPMYVTFAITEEEYLWTQALRSESGQSEEEYDQTNPIELILADNTVYSEKGVFLVAERAVAEQTGTLQLVATFANPDALLRPGQFGRCRLRVMEVEDAVLCPQRAVMEQQGSKTVQVVGEGDVVELRSVEILERHEDAYIISKGLEGGERVVLEGQLKARPGHKVIPTDQPVSSEPGVGDAEIEDSTSEGEE